MNKLLTFCCSVAEPNAIVIVLKLDQNLLDCNSVWLFAASKYQARFAVNN